MTIWEQLGECVETLSEPFSAREIRSCSVGTSPLTRSRTCVRTSECVAASPQIL